MSTRTGRRAPAVPTPAPALDDDAGVVVRLARDQAGAAFFTPVGPALDRLSLAQHQALVDVELHARALDGFVRHLDELVDTARAAGVSWALIGPAAGLTGEGARQRWGLRD